MKRKTTQHKMRKQRSVTVQTAREPSVIAEYLALTVEGKLERLAELAGKYARLQSDLRNNVESLHNCTDGELRENLMKQHSSLTVDIDDLKETMNAIFAIPLREGTPALQKQRLVVGPKTNSRVLTRDITILKYAHLSDREICRKLDADLLEHEGPPLGFPESWNEKFHVNTYLAAYQHAKCRGLVQKLISTAKKRFGSLP
jgi:hypothetical protein